MLVLDLLLELLYKQDDSLVSHGKKKQGMTGKQAGKQTGR